MIAESRSRVFCASFVAIAIVALVVSTASSLVGCSALSSGPETMKEVSASAMTVTTTLASQMSPKNLTANASGEVHNPEYQCEGFVGTGVKWDITLRLIGAELDFNIAAAGEGKLEPDEKILAAIQDIQDRRDITEDKKRGLIAQAIADWIASKMIASAQHGGDGTGGGGNSQTPQGGSASSASEK